MCPELQTLEAATGAKANSLRWYALRVRPRLEKLVSDALRGKGYEEWLPMHRTRHQWSDRVKQLDRPFFPGYLFCRFDVDDRLLPILTTPGVLAIVGAGKTPIPVPGDEIAAIRSVIRSGLPAQPWRHLTAGSRVCIERGALAGVEGIVLKVDKAYRLIVSIHLLQRAVAVEIDRDWVRPASNGAGRHIAPLIETRQVSNQIA